MLHLDLLYISFFYLSSILPRDKWGRLVICGRLVIGQLSRCQPPRWVRPCESIGYHGRMSSRITDRIERNLGIGGLAQALASKLPASDLRSLLMEVYRDRAAAVKDADIRERAARDPLMAASTVSANTATVCRRRARSALTTRLAIDSLTARDPPTLAVHGRVHDPDRAGSADLQSRRTISEPGAC